MNELLDDLLCQRYPKIFAQRRTPKDTSGMAWGIMCGDGWFDLLDTLFSKLQFQTDQCRAPQVIATHVKEKFGALSFYRGKANEAQRGMISLAEAMSTRICENCGKPGRTLVFNSWEKMLCPEHAPECARPLGIG